MIERSAEGVPVDAGQELELPRMEWFIKRFGSHLDGLIHLPAEAHDERGEVRHDIS